MRSRFSHTHVIDALFPLALLLVFFSSAVMTLLLAADIYRESTGRSSLSHTSSTVTAYLVEKVHQGDEAGRVYLDKQSGCQVLTLEHTGDGEGYCTYLYYYDGALRELMTRQDLPLNPDRGREIIPLESFRVQQAAEGLLYFTCTDMQGSTASAYAAVRSDGEVSHE